MLFPMITNIKKKKPKQNHNNKIKIPNLTYYRDLSI